MKVLFYFGKAQRCTVAMCIGHCTVTRVGPLNFWGFSHSDTHILSQLVKRPFRQYAIDPFILHGLCLWLIVSGVSSPTPFRSKLWLNQTSVTLNVFSLSRLFFTVFLFILWPKKDQAVKLQYVLSLSPSHINCPSYFAD